MGTGEQGTSGEGGERSAVVAGGHRVRGRRRHVQQPPTKLQIGAPPGPGQEAEVADAVEVRRQDMQQEAAHELVGGQAHGLPAMLLAIVLPTEPDHAVVDRHEAVVGEGDAMGVATEVVECAGGAVEGTLGVDHPGAAPQGLQVAGKGGGLGQRSEFAAEAETALAEVAFEAGEEEGAKAAGQDAHRQEEAGAAADPALAVGGQAAAGHDAVQVGVEAEVRAPRMQDAQAADAGPEVAGVGGDLTQAAGGGPEQQGVEAAAVLQGELGEGGRQGEHDMKILAVEQFGAALQEPAVACQSLALGTVAVAAGAIAETAVAASVTLFDQTAEGGGAALLDGRHDLALQGGEGLAGLRPEGLSVAAEDVGDLEAGAAHRSAAERLVGKAGSRSNGLVAEQTWLAVMRR